MFHAMEDLIQTFTSILILKEDPKSIQIFFVDNLKKGPFLPIWKKIFSPNYPLIFLNELKVRKKMCCQKTIHNVHGGVSFLTYRGVGKETICSSDLLKLFSNYVKNKFKIIPKKDNKFFENKNIVWISRRQYKNISHTITRIIKNENDVIQDVQNILPNKFRMYKIYFAQLSLKKQLLISSNTHVLIGVHGVGLTHAIFMNPGSHLIEMFLPGYRANKHFYNIAKWMNIHYHDVDISDQVNSKKNIFILNNIIK